MLNGIKSPYIVKKLFNFLNEEKKLKLVIYNKKINKILNLTAIDIMRLSGKYLIEDKNGYQKEYNSFNDELIYEGEFLKGKKMEEEKNIQIII